MTHTELVFLAGSVLGLVSGWEAHKVYINDLYKMYLKLRKKIFRGK